MPMSLDAAAEAFREAMRETVKRHSLWYLIQGAMLVAAGALAIIYPVISSVAVIVLLGWLLVISGIVQGVSLIGARHAPHFWLQLISLILAVLIGLLFLRDPEQGLLTITLLLIVFFMIEGISKVVFALTIRPFPNWAWVLASGLVGILLAGLLWASLPVTALWLIGLMLGIKLISVGAAIGYLAWQTRRSGPDQPSPPPPT
ncbi:HdeD family acid-resistance protein [Vineibacter terrae]|uniref:HdeD family acid-resistance protein n=1 Tax=Vineibacter terrae TaxID=2586908 RepID=A0A5C8PTC9_9HYPH|nr:HdeD family acid-resistance protein [Vineibacter terrae]TXL81612.1 HdeD family acid-resistance protein [Vineibacter terrae]